jgi:ribose 5-phosphate isomerase B
MQTILIAADHAGFELKQELIPFLRDLGYEAKDFGADAFDAEDDYPDFIAPLAQEVSKSGGTVQGIIIGGSGQGEAIVANRFRHVRAVVFNGQFKPDAAAQAGYDRHIPLEVKTAREHNDANVLSLGARFLSESEAKEAVKTFLTIPFSEDERHVRRLKKIDELGGLE